MSTLTDRRAGLSSSLALKAPVALATTANLSALSGYQTIDGVLLTSSMHVDLRRVLVKNQTDSADNGIYTMDTGPWERTKDFNGVHDFREGTRIYVYDGSTQFGAHVITSSVDPSTFVIDTTGITIVSATSVDSFLQVGTGAVNRTIQSKLRDHFHVKDFGATGDGVTDDRPFIDAALLAAATAGVGTVLLTAGTYRVGTWITMQPGVRLLGDGDATITQANAANLSPLVSFSSTAHGATLENVIVDGNRSNNTDSSGVALVHTFTANNASVINCTIVNSCGYLVATNGLYTTFADNTLSNCYVQAIGVFTQNGSGVSQDSYPRILNNTISVVGLGAMILGSCNYGQVIGNHISGTVIGGRGDRVVVNTSGTTVTWVSGTQFTGIKPGMIFVVNNGQEFTVTAVTATTLTVSSAMSTLSGVEASVGSGDLIGVVASSSNIIAYNTVFGGATFGVGTSQGGSASQTSYNTFAHNIITGSGKHAISIAYDTGTGFSANTSIIGNKILNPGNSGGLAVGSEDKIGIYVSSVTAGKVVNVIVDGNTVQTAGGDGQTEYWLGTDGNCNAGTIRVGTNYDIDMVNPGLIKRDCSTGLSFPAAGAMAWSTSGVEQFRTSSNQLILAQVGAVGAPAVTFTGDLDTGWWSPAANALAWSTSGVEQLRMFGNQLVLQQHGSAATPSLVFTSDGTTGWYRPAANQWGLSISTALEFIFSATAFTPGADGGNSLGSTALGWQNFFGNTGFVLNIENSDWVATHTTGILTVGTGELRVTTPGTNAASVATLNATQTLTSKTIALGSNTVSGTLAQFNTAVTDADLASLAGSETLTNKTLTSLNTGPLAGFRNAVVNGAMMVSQAATSFTDSGAANNDDSYTLDQWILLSNGNDIVDVSQDTADVPTGGLYAAKMLVATVNKKFGLLQIIEQKNCTGLIGNTVTLSFKAKVSNATRLATCKAVILAWDSTADVVTSDVVSAWGADGTTPTWAANWTAENTPADLNFTTSWATYSVSAAVDTASAKNIAVFIWSDNETDTDAADTMNIADVQLEIGSAATVFERRPYAVELDVCRRYFWIWLTAATFDYLAPAQAYSTTGALCIVEHPEPMRVAPTATVVDATKFAMIDAGSSALACTVLAAAGFGNSNPHKTVMQATVASGLVAGNASALANNNATGGSIKFSAQL